MKYRRPPRPSDASQRERVLVDVVKRSMASSGHEDSDEKSAPTLYVLNAAAVTKPHAVQHLTADLIGYKVDVATGGSNQAKLCYEDCL